MRAATLMLLTMLAFTATASAQQRGPKDSSPSMAVVVESAGGVVMARKVRALLARDAGLAIHSLRRFTRGKKRPDVVLTVSVLDSREISVMYWDRRGTAESLSAPVPRARATASLVAASLAVALVRRNLPSLKDALSEDPIYPHYGRRGHGESAVSSLSPSQLQAFFANLARVHHRTEGLTVADFQ
ncbi:MAG: hypothetical protein OXU20_41165 [Myxococcales bacterium]|nr:hypothetical protein [Myxococcales bacterium]